jgi:hypothetical protein
MALRNEIVARIQPKHPHPLTQFEFESAQKVIRSLRRQRETLERLGFTFIDRPGG